MPGAGVDHQGTLPSRKLPGHISAPRSLPPACLGNVTPASPSVQTARIWGPEAMSNHPCHPLPT